MRPDPRRAVDAQNHIRRMAQMDNRDEFQVTEDAIRGGGESAEKATMAEMALVLEHMVQVCLSTFGWREYL